MNDLDRLTAQSSPAGFAWVAEGCNKGAPTEGWKPFPHLLLLSDKLMQVAAGECKRLIVTTPPRHGKSQMISQYFPAWYLGTFPRRQVILSSNTATLAQNFSRSARNILTELGPEIFGVSVRDDSRAADRWHTTAGGVLIAAGVGGPLTGRGAHCLIIDDPIKNSEEAHSETIREKQWEWWQSTARTRLMRDASVVVVLTRWHEDDLAGKLMRQAEEQPGADEWELLNLPAFARAGDPVGRAEGEALCPELISAEELESTKASTSSYWWGAMYMQEPTPDEGGIFHRDWWRYWRTPDEFQIHRLCQSWDLSFKDGDGSDFVAGQLWGCDQAERILLAQVHARLDFPSTLRAIRAMHAYAAQHWPAFASHPVYVEDAANGPAVIQSLQREIPGIHGVRPDGGKLARAHNIAHIPEAGQVRFPEGQIPAPDGYVPSRVDVLIDELAAFPNGAHDDQVDALTQALSKLATVQGGRVRGGGSGKRDISS